MAATHPRVKRKPPHLLGLIAVVAMLVAISACSGNEDDDIIVLSLPPTAVATTQADGAVSTASESAGDAFVSEAVAEAKEAEQNHVPTPTPTLIPRGETPTETTSTPERATPAPTSPASPTSASGPATSAPSKSATPAATSNASDGTTGSAREWERPAACSDGYERVYEAFATDSPPIGIAICVSSDGRAEYVGLDVTTNNRIRLAACVSGTDFVANNADSVYVVDIGQDMIRYPQAPQGRHLDAVTMITSAATIPALGC